jgi:hypothetical protein
MVMFANINGQAVQLSDEEEASIIASRAEAIAATAIAAAAAAITNGYASAIAAGIAITSTGTPTLNGTYGIAQSNEIALTGLQVSVISNVFPGYYRNQAGVRVTMTAAQFTALATAALGLIEALDNALAAAQTPGGAWVAVSNAVTIA